MATVYPVREVLPALLAFSDRFHRAVGDTHHVASPLGAWMLLAVAATTAPPGPARARLAAALGMEPATAADYVRRLLERPHEAVAAGLALWTREEAESEALSEWRATLPNGIASGPMPDAVGAAAWLRDASRGLLTDPPAFDRDDLLLFLSVVAMRSRWLEPYEITTGQLLAAPRTDREPRSSPGGQWADCVSLCLHSGYGSGGSIVYSPLAGDVAVHSRLTGDGIRVYSVIAAPLVAPTTVLLAAQQIATAIELGDDVLTRSIYDLPIGNSPCWSIEERVVDKRPSFDQVEAVLPAWSARSNHELLKADLGFNEAVSQIEALIGLPLLRSSVEQKAFARYSRLGFEASAITRILTGPTFRKAPPEAARFATLRFGHPFAAVAVAVGGPGDGVVDGRFVRSPWRGLPIFSAWITDPEETVETPFTEKQGRRQRQELR